MTPEIITVQLRDQMIYYGERRKRREVLTVPAQVAEHLVEYRKATIIDDRKGKEQ